MNYRKDRANGHLCKALFSDADDLNGLNEADGLNFSKSN